MEVCKDAFELFVPSDEENKILHELDGTYTKVSEMTNEEREFLNAIILRKKPKKLLEVGVSAGGSTVIMLNAIKSNLDSILYSIDYSLKWYFDKTYKTGHIVDSYPDLKDKWTLFTGGLSLNFLEEIGSDIDLCLIDTVHSNPGELLDILMVFPFLKEDAIIIFHDVNCHTLSGNIAECNSLGLYTNNLLFSAIYGKKYVQGNFKKNSPFPNQITDKTPYFPNIGAIGSCHETRKHFFEIFNLLTLKWTYLLTETEENSIITFLSKYYDNYFIEYIKEIFVYHRECSKYPKDIVSLKYLIREIIKKLLGKKLLEKIRKIKNG